jgi:hypothetical protein
MLAAPAAHAQSASTPGHPNGRPPVRLWYRIAVIAALSTQGDFASPVYTDHRSVNVTLRLRSRTAVLLYRQCEAVNVAGFEPKVIAQIIDLTRSAVSCDQVRAEAWRLGFSRLEIGRTSAAEPVGGRLDTASAARDGVATAVFFPTTLTSPAAVGSEGGPCHVRSTGAETLVPHLATWFRGDAFGPSPAYGATPTPSLMRFRIGRRFGQPFDIQTRESVQEPLTNGTWVTSSAALVRFKIGNRFGDSFDVDEAGVVKEPLGNGTWVTSGATELHFEPCPRGGRDVSGC